MQTIQENAGPGRQFYYFDAQLSRPRGTSPWERLSSNLTGDPGNMVVTYDDFKNHNTTTTSDTWQAVKGTGGAITVNATANGYVSIPTAASANDYQSFFDQAATVKFANYYPAVFEAYVNVTEANTNKSSWWVGFNSSTTTGGMSATGGLLTSFSGAGFLKNTGAMTLTAFTSNGSTQKTQIIPTVTGGSTNYTVVSGQSYVVGMYLDPNDGTTGIVTWYVSTIISGVWTFIATGTLNLTLASLANMYNGFGIYAGSSSAETLTIDYYQSYAVRNLI